MLGNHPLHFAQIFAEARVEMILDAVVSPRWKEMYLPGRCCAMVDHLLPIYPCTCKRVFSSSTFQLSVTIEESRWL